jgi:hypothetical protein
MRKCEICGEYYDEQFISQYQRTEQVDNYINHDVIHVCECCDHPEWDEEYGVYYIVVDGVRWYN